MRDDDTSTVYGTLPRHRDDTRYNPGEHGTMGDLERHCQLRGLSSSFEGAPPAMDAGPDSSIWKDVFT